MVSNSNLVEEMIKNFIYYNFTTGKIIHISIPLLTHIAYVLKWQTRRLIFSKIFTLKILRMQ